MKAKFLILFFTFISFNLFGQSAQKVEIIVKTYYETGELRTLTKFTNGVANGVHFSFHKSGEIKDKGFFENGLESGIWESYDEEGNLYVQGSFEQGNKHGVWKIWDPYGVLRFEKIYHNQVLESWVERDSNGLIVSASSN